MLLIWGKRHYGRVDEHRGQHAVTRFVHFWFVPIVPQETIWVLDPARGTGHVMKTSARSVLSGYGRVWGPLAAIGGAVAAAGGSLAAIPVAAAALAVGAWSWTTRSLRNDRDKLRSDFHLLAYGTRCDPLQMTDRMIATLREDVAARWAEVSDGRTPEDVARLGGKDLKQAVFAYGMLRLAAIHVPAAREASEEILRRYAGADVAAVEGGPYRSLPG